MRPRLHIVSLGVDDLGRALRFYRDGLGWPLSSASGGDFAIFDLDGAKLALYPRRLLAADARLRYRGRGFDGVTLAQNVATRAEVAPSLRRAVAAGGKLLKPAADTAWGGCSGYFADPDGHAWEVAWAPMFRLGRDGRLRLP